MDPAEDDKLDFFLIGGDFGQTVRVADMVSVLGHFKPLVVMGENG